MYYNEKKNLEKEDLLNEKKNNNQNQKCICCSLKPYILTVYLTNLSRL